MILVAFLCFALLFLAWLIAPGLDRSAAATAGVTETATDLLAANARI